MNLAGRPLTFLHANAVAGLLAAATWGGGDFAGGMGVKVSGGGTVASLRVITIGHAVSLLVLLAFYELGGGRVPHGVPVVWALLAGATAGLSITAFYMALASGAMGASAAISGLLAAAIPAAASAVLEGRPSATQLTGFLLAGLAIWLIAAGPADPHSTSPHASRRTLLLSIFGGLGFGVYFFLLKLANSLGVLAPVAIARMGSLLACGTLLLVLGVREKPVQTGSINAPVRESRFLGLSRQAFYWALGVALLDTGGNLLYLESTRLGRLDVAAVLASLYPAGTILLAAVYLHERPTRQQLAGMALAGAAVVLVTLS